MRALLTRLVLAVALTVSGWAATGAPFTGQQVQGISDPRSLTGLAAWYDVADTSSIIKDGSNRVQLIADKSGNSSVNVLALNGVAANFASTPDSAAVSILSDIELVGRFAPESWAPAAINVLANKYAAAGQRSYRFYINTTGKLHFDVSADGTAVGGTDSSVATGFSAYSTNWVKITWRASDGRTQFFTAADQSSEPSSWTQLGTDMTVAIASIFDSTSALEIGVSNGVFPFAGRIYQVILRNGIAGTVAFNANFALPAKLATSFTESSSNAATVTINTTGDLGARICGARDLVQMTASKMPRYLAWSGTNYGYLNGVSGAYFSSPDSAAVSITGDIDIRAYVALADWTPSTANVLLSKYTSGGQYSFQIYVNTDGRLRASISRDGTGATVSDVGSTNPLSVSDLGSLWVRFTRASSDGAYVLYTSTDGSTWSNIGSGSTTAGSLFDSTALVLVGANNDGGTGTFRMSGSILRAQIYNGIAGTLAFDFNPATYTSGTTFLDSSSNAATITLNGGSTIVTRTCLYFDGSDDYMKAASFAQPQPVTRLTVGSHVTWTSGDYLWDGASAANTGALIQTTTTPQLNLNAGSSVAANTNFTLNTQFIFTEVIDGASSSLQANKLTATTGNAGAGVPNGITIGASGASTAANFANITFSERVSYGSLTAAQIVAVQQYLARKWSISGGFAFTPVIQPSHSPDIAPWRREDELIAA